MPAYTYRNSPRIIEVDDPVETPGDGRGLLKEIFLVMGSGNTPWGSVWLRDGSTQDWPLADLTYCPPEAEIYEELVDRPSRESELMDQVENLKRALEERDEGGMLRLQLLNMVIPVTPEREGEPALDHVDRIVTKAEEMMGFLVRPFAWAQDDEPFITRPFSAESVIIGSDEPVVEPEEDDGVLAVLTWGPPGGLFNITNRSAKPSATEEGEAERG